jgi:hypothetical protein
MTFRPEQYPEQYPEQAEACLRRQFFGAAG